MEQTRTKRIGDARIGDVSGEDSDVPHEDSDVSLRRVYQYQYPVFKRLESNVYFPARAHHQSARHSSIPHHSLSARVTPIGA